MTNVAQLNDEILGGVMRGMESAANKFAERMQEIREANQEQKLSDFWKDYAYSLAHQVDDLTAVLNKQNVLISEREILLRQTTEQVNKFRDLSGKHSEYLDLVVKRLTKVEDILQRQSAHSFALDEFRKVALEELKTIQDPSQSKLINPDLQIEFLENAWEKFMKTTSVKRGIPKLGVDAP